MKLFANRTAAGRALAAELREYAGRPDVIVLALPRGGVPVAYEIAAAIRAPLDVLTVRKLGAPWNEEFAIGAIASGGLVYVDEESVRALGVDAHDLNRVIDRESRELARRDRLYRGTRRFPALAGMTVIIVDDGLATGATMWAAVQAVRESHPSRVIVAAPVASPQACEMLGTVADRVVVSAKPDPFFGVGLWYEDFSETSDGEVLELLERQSAAELQQTAT